MLTALWLMLSSALAADPAYDGTLDPTEAAKKPESDLSAEFGFSFASGNAWVINASGAVNFAHKWKQNRFKTFVGTNLNLAIPDADAADDADGDGDTGVGTANDERAAGDPFVFTSQRVFGGLRYDRFFGESDSLYVAAGAEHDPFAGLLWRFNQQIGYSRVLVKTDKTLFDLEAGLSYNEENLVAGTDANGNPTNAAELDAHYLAFRFFLGLSHAFNDIVSISETVEAIEPLVAFRADNPDTVTNFEDFRLINVFAITTKVSDKFSLKVSDRLMFDNQQPGPEYSKVDNTVMLTLVATIL